LPVFADPDEIRRQAQWRRENDNPAYFCLLFNEKSEMVAVSSVDINLNNTREIEQKMTGVARSYRGRGLAKWLKAAMFVKLHEEFPDNEVLTTFMRAVNDPILSINARMGFELEQQGFEFQLTRKNLEKRFRSDQ
jgi:hypothetical protein